MKILKLRFKNLNSLYGEWEVDFTGSHYQTEGIFAITGPTGAGKSTLLDALCLALYGATPRLDKITKSGNQVLSRGRGECFSELTFSIKGRIYRSFWSQRRARNKADGNLLDPTHELSDQVKGEILSAKKRETQQLIESITGMDLDRFMRSMLLAQGGFDAFLKAQPDERAPILEQITGTAIYSDISKAVHQRYRLEKEKLHEIRKEEEYLQLLPPEEKEQIENQLAQAQRESSRLQKEQQQLEAWRNRKKRLMELTENLSQSKKEQSALEEEIEQFAPMRQRLELAEKTEQLVPLYSRLETGRELCRKEKLNLRQYKEQIPEQEKEIGRQKQQLEELNQALEQHKEEDEKLYPLLQQVRQLDIQIREKQESLRQEKANLDQRSHRIEQLQQQQTELTQQERQWDQQTAESRCFMDEHIHWKDLGSLLPGLRELWKNRDQYNQRIQQFREELTHIENQKQQQKQRVEENLQKEKEKQQELDEIVEQLKGLKTRHLEELNNRSLREYKEELRHGEEKLKLLRVISNLESQRHQLEDGKPCPLCGSLEHPYAEGNIPEQNEEEIKQQKLEAFISQREEEENRLARGHQQEEQSRSALSYLQEQKALLNENLESTEHQLLKMTGDLENLESQLSESREDIQKQLESLQLAPEEYSRPDLLQWLQNQYSQWQKHQQLLEDQSRKKQELQEQRQLLQGQLSVEQENLQQISHEHREQQKKLKDLETQRQNLYGADDPGKGEAIHREKGEKLKQQGEQCRIRWEEAKRIHHASLSGEERSRKNLEELLQEKGRLEEEFLQQAQERGFQKEEDFKKARMDPSALADLRQQSDRLIHKKDLLKERIRQIHSELKKVEDQEAPAMELEELQRNWEELMENLARVQQQSGALQQQLNQHDQALKQLKQNREALERQQKECLRWEKLHSLIGSADGKKYRNFAQGLSFERMIYQANRQLQKMNDRYLLIRDQEEPLELNVMDNYQAGEIRSTRNLSGGESFIISLALALGLAGISGSRIPLESLFLDEGFGTLDEESLDTALETLAELQQSGKMIGVISHVPAMKERIATQIKIEKGPGGKSRILGPGCRELI